MGSPAIAAFIGLWAFWILIAYGLAVRELRVAGAVIFVLLWAAGRIGAASLAWTPAHLMFAPYVAALDIALVFVIFKGDVRLT